MNVNFEFYAKNYSREHGLIKKYQMIKKMLVFRVAELLLYSKSTAIICFGKS